MDTNWTEGEWWIEEETGDIVAKDGDWEICTFSRSDEHLDADRVLIKTAPKLYEALSNLLEELDNTPEIDLSSWGISTHDARAALTEARGEV